MKDLNCVSIFINESDDNSRINLKKIRQIDGVASTALERYLKESSTFSDQLGALFILDHIESLNYFDAKRLLERDCAALTDIDNVRENAMQIYSDIESKEIKSNILYEIALIYQICNNGESNAVKYFEGSALLGNKYSMYELDTIYLYSFEHKEKEALKWFVQSESYSTFEKKLNMELY